MTPLEAIALEMFQGVTEPLGAGCSASLVILLSLVLGLHQPSLSFDVVLLLGALISEVFFFRRDSPPSSLRCGPPGASLPQSRDFWP